MKRETIINLAFLLVFLVISLPGAFMLFKAKLDPGARIMYEPGHVRKSAAYNAPLPTASDMIRTFPPKTLGWVEQTVQLRLDRAPLRLVAAGGRIQPLISQERQFELLDVQPATVDDPAQVVVLAWTPAFALGEVEQVEATLVMSDETERRVDQVELERLKVPFEVVKELKDAGFVRPPTAVSLVRLEYSDPAVPANLPMKESVPVREVRMRWRTGEKWSQDVLQIVPTLLERSPTGKDASSAAR